MAKKIYASRWQMCSYNIVVDGKVKNIEFRGGYSNTYGRRYSTYTTDNVKIQNAIEALPQFSKVQGGELFLDAVIGKENVEDIPTIETVTEFEHIKTLREAQDVLEVNFNVQHSDITTKAKLFAVANKMNVQFPNLN